ncbi:MAG: hypothetical protein QW815_06615, partial [Nitrososphaerota archaeon]
RDELLSGLEDLLTLYNQISVRIKDLRSPTATPTSSRRRRGRSEAVEVLRHLEEKIITTNFFKQPRSTSDVRAKLKEVVGVLFQSRKVSQALGILHGRGALSRVGQRGSYKYYVR